MKEIIILILGFLIGSIFKPIKKFIHSETMERCTYLPPHSPKKKENYQTFDIVVTKYFGKIIHINCHWWCTVYKVKYKNAIFDYCNYGNFLSDVTSGPNRKCHFTKIKYLKTKTTTQPPKK